MYETKRLEMINVCKEKGIDYKYLGYVKSKPSAAYSKHIVSIAKFIKYYDFAILFFDTLFENPKQNYFYVDDALEVAKEINDYERMLKYYEIEFKYNKYSKYASKYLEVIDVCMKGKFYIKAIEYCIILMRKEPFYKLRCIKTLIEIYTKLEQFNKVIEYYDVIAKGDSSIEAEPVIEKLGYLYLHGHFEGYEEKQPIVKIDARKAISYYKKHSKKNILIGKIYYYGLGNEEVDYKKAFKYFDGTHDNIELIECYYYGRGVDINYTTALFKLEYLSLKFFENKYVCDMFLDCIDKTKIFTSRSHYLDLNIKFLFHKIMANRGVDSSYYEYGNLAELKYKDYRYNLHKNEYYNYAFDGYSKYLSIVEKDILSKDDEEKKKYLTAIEFVYKDKAKPFNYYLIKADSNDINYFYFVGKYFVENKDVNKGKYYLNKFIKCYEDGTYKKDQYSDKDYIYAYEQVNEIGERHSIGYKEKKYNLGEIRYAKELGLAYFYGNVVNKNVDKARKYLEVYLKSIQSSVNPNDIEICKEYIYISDLIDLKNKTIYVIAKASLGESKYYCEVAKYYKDGISGLIKPNADFSKKFFELCLKELEKYVVEVNPNLEKVKEYIKLFNEIYPNGENRGFKFYLAYALFKNPRALFTIGVYYEYGDQVEKDLDKAMYYFTKSAELNYEPAIDKINAYKYQKEREENDNKLDVIKAVRYIQLLELNEDEDITEEDVRNAYKQLSRIYHPDISNKRYTDGKKFVELKDAHDYLLEHIDQIRDLVTKYFK